MRQGKGTARVLPLSSHLRLTTTASHPCVAQPRNRRDRPGGTVDRSNTSFKRDLEAFNLLEVLLRLELARQVAADQLHRRQRPVGHCRLHLVDGGLVQLEAEAVGHGEQIVRAGILLQRDQVGRHGEHLRDVEGRDARDEGGRPGELGTHGEKREQAETNRDGRVRSNKGGNKKRKQKKGGSRRDYKRK